MNRFKNILLGVDLANADVLVSEDLLPPTEEAIHRALWLAKKNAARLTYFYALEVTARTELLIAEDPVDDDTVLGHAREVLSKLVQRARQEGVTAEATVVCGKAWIELIRQVLRGQHDMVVIGTRHMGQVGSVLLGSVGMKMLRKCPVPVWVTQPQGNSRIESVLVPTDFTEVCDHAMELACGMAGLQEAQLHVVHALQHVRVLARSHHPTAEDVERQVQEARQKIQAQLEKFGHHKQAQIHVLRQPADAAILEQIDKYKIQLLVMGTVARAGIPGLLMGNTAERLLPRIPCSVLAVKPTGFVSPITSGDD